MKYVVNLKKGNACHKDLSAVMANTGFSGLSIKTASGMNIYIPKHGLTKQGKVKKVWRDRLQDFSVEDALWLNEKIAA